MAKVIQYGFGGRTDCCLVSVIDRAFEALIQTIGVYIEGKAHDKVSAVSSANSHSVRTGAHDHLHPIAREPLNQNPAPVTANKPISQHVSMMMSQRREGANQPLWPKAGCELAGLGTR